MTEEPATRAQTLSRQLQSSGHTEASTHLAAAAAHPHPTGLLETLREACQSVLTMIEAVDPASYAAVDELRLDIDRRLNTGRTSG